MSHTYYDVIVVGGGIAAVSCVNQLCVVGETKRVLLISASQSLKGIRNVVHITDNLADFDIYQQSLEDLQQKHNNLTVRQGEVIQVNSKLRQLTMRQPDGHTLEQISYGDLCVCTGARPHTIFPNHPHILGIRDGDSVNNLRAKLQVARRVALVGNGGIALELVCALQTSGIDVIWITKDHYIGNTFLDASASEFLSKISSYITTSSESVDDVDAVATSVTSAPNKRIKKVCCPKHAPMNRPTLASTTQSNPLTVSGSATTGSNVALPVDAGRDASSSSSSSSRIAVTRPATTTTTTTTTTSTSAKPQPAHMSHAVGPEWIRQLQQEQQNTRSPDTRKPRATKKILWKWNLLMAN